jgi:predicted MPP superfamily phosphohydrolase
LTSNCHAAATQQSREPQSRESDLEAKLAKRRAVEESVSNGQPLERSSPFLLRHNHIRPFLKAALTGLGLYERGLRNALKPQVRTVKLAFRNLPKAFDGFRILQLADLHIDGMDGLTEAVAEVVSECAVDLCVMTGDYRFETYGSCAAVYPRMREIYAEIRAEFGVLAILGNHDAAEMAPEFEKYGIRMLVNEAVELRRPMVIGDRAQRQSLWIAGVDDPHEYQCDDMPQALADVPPDDFKILLAHTPEMFQEASYYGVDLYLCGHTHAGQLALPFLGAPIQNANCPREFTQGQWQYKKLQGYTSAGVGCSMLPVRFNCPPEIVIFELTSC